MTTVPFFGKASAVTLVMQLANGANRPLSAMIEVADRCNHTCAHCYQVQGQKGEMTLDEIRRVIDELADLGVLFLTISGGEATLRHDFLDIVAHARARRFAVKVFTNGYTMTPDLARSLRALAVQEVQISLYSHRDEVHDWVTRVPGSWDKTVDGVRALVAEGVRVVVKTPLMSVNIDERDAYVELVRSLGADYSLDPGGLNPREDGDRTPETLNPSVGSLAEALRDPQLGAGAPPGLVPDVPLDSSVCGACTGNIHVEANGEMRPCTQLAVSCGSVRDGGVREAWEGSTARSIRSLTWRDLHGCRDCDLQPYCGHCYADASVTQGDALGPYASACKMARVRFERSSGRAFVLVEGSPPGRDPSLGPFRARPDGAFELADDVAEDRDHALAAALGWTRRDHPTGAPGFATTPGALVQIRRPGARRAEREQVPAISDERMCGIPR